MTSQLSEPAKRFLLRTTAGGLILVAVVLALLCGRIACILVPKTWDFSRLGWRIASNGSRASMARDYLQTRTIQGRTLDEVQADLGQPERFTDSWWYALSPTEPGSDLVVQFTRDGRASSVRGTFAVIPPAPAAFEPGTWRSRGADREAAGYGLVERQDLTGLSKESVRHRLGDPDAGVIVLEYVIGWKSVSDPATVTFRLDAEGRVIDALIDE